MEEKNNQKEEITLDKLAALVQDGFIELKTELKTEFKTEINEVKTEINEVKKELGEVKADTEKIKRELVKKVDTFVHNDLKYRVEKLEEKFA